MSIPASHMEAGRGFVKQAEELGAKVLSEGTSAAATKFLNFIYGLSASHYKPSLEVLTAAFERADRDLEGAPVDVEVRAGGYRRLRELARRYGLEEKAVAYDSKACQLVAPNGTES